ncbi:hypothetical protein ABID95_005757 [Streptomyces atratus]|uniref:hypothetical protein n=1 Tax=Streptomyces atratus TaxID=1893 RepID=UPI003394ADD7
MVSEDAGCQPQFLMRDRDGKLPELFDAVLSDAGEGSGSAAPSMSTAMWPELPGWHSRRAQPMDRLRYAAWITLRHKVRVERISANQINADKESIVRWRSYFS